MNRMVPGPSALSRPIRLFLAAASLLCIRCAGEPAGTHAAPDVAAATAPAGWSTYTDPSHRFSFHYPPDWKINDKSTIAFHYTQILVSLNSFGKENFAVKEVQTSPQTWEMNETLLGQLLPPGAAYLEIAWTEGPGPLPVIGPGVVEMERDDLAKVPAATQEAGGITTRICNFVKWGHHWEISIMLHNPVTPATRQAMDQVAASFRFTGPPSGDRLWALSRAVKFLPAEADPSMFHEEGGSSQYYTQLRADGPNVIVTFHKDLPNTPKQAWAFRVTAAGDVKPLPATDPDVKGD